MLSVNDKISIPLTEFKFSYARSPGPGGQNVNKVNTKVILKWSFHKTESLPEGVKERFKKKYGKRISKEGEFVMSSHRFRDQGRNVADCLAKLRTLILDVAPEPVPRKPAKISRGAKERRLTSKRHKSQIKNTRRRPRLDD